MKTVKFLHIYITKFEIAMSKLASTISTKKIKSLYLSARLLRNQCQNRAQHPQKQIPTYVLRENIKVSSFLPEI